MAALSDELQSLVLDEEVGGLPREARRGQKLLRRLGSPCCLVAAAGACGLSLGIWQHSARVLDPQQNVGHAPSTVVLEDATLQAQSEGFAPVAIKWTAEQNQCIRVGPSSTLGVDDCGTDAFEFTLQEGSQGPIKLAQDPLSCLTINSESIPTLVVEACGVAPLEWVVGGDRIRLKSNQEHCIFVDTFDQDANGRYPLRVEDCELWHGDLSHPPQPRDYQFELEKATTLTSTTTQANAGVARAVVDNPRLPYRTMLKSVHGNYIVAVPGGAMFANRRWADDWEKFEVLYKSEDTVALRSYHGFYVSAGPLGIMMATSGTAEGNETSFTVTFLSDGAVVLKSWYGLYVSASPWGLLVANRVKADSWEEFVVMDVADNWPSQVSIKSVNHKYLRGDPSGSVMANGLWPLDDWERFNVHHNSDGTISLQCDHGDYISVNSSGAVMSQQGISDTERFTVTHLPDGNFTLQDHTGRHVIANPNGTVTARSTGLFNDLEKLEVIFLK